VAMGHGGASTGPMAQRFSAAESHGPGVAVSPTNLNVPPFLASGSKCRREAFKSSYFFLFLVALPSSGTTPYVASGLGKASTSDSFTAATTLTPTLPRAPLKPR
jgi:hypothetical protein